MIFIALKTRPDFDSSSLSDRITCDLYENFVEKPMGDKVSIVRSCLSQVPRFWGNVSFSQVSVGRDTKKSRHNITSFNNSCTDIYNFNGFNDY